MISPKVAALLERIPERAVRSASGTAFDPHASRCAEPERFSHVCRFLQWLTPLHSLSKEDQQALGIATGGSRLSDAADGTDDSELEVEEPVA